MDRVMVIETLPWTATPPDKFRYGAVAVGNYDGVHRGHSSLLQVLRQQAQQVGGPTIAVTFDPHPLQLLRPEQFMPVLTSMADRAALLCEQGADGVLILRTTPDLLQLRAAEFFHEVIQTRLAARAMVEGPNFGFGRGREGNVARLGELCREAGLALVVVPPLEIDGRPVSSSRVRHALERGDVREAAALLDRCYRLRGSVGRGQARGRTLGFPTANLEGVETLVPGDGVYAVRVHAQEVWPGAANVGPNPTFGEKARKIEVHLIGFQGDLVGQPVAIDFVERLRDTRPFGSVAELVAQLRVDVEQARRLVTR
jgi:riboflavin kinase/FMN adenylyltransferase